MDSVSILNINIDCFTTKSLNERILLAAHNNEHITIANVNVHAMNITAKEERFKQFINDADYCFCDGHGIMLAARILGQHIPEKITYADWLPQLALYCEIHPLSIYLLGGRPGIADKAAEKLKTIAPQLNVAGTHHGFFDMDADSVDNKKIIDRINKTKPNILLVCFGMPLQEYWLQKNWSKINANVALTGGAAFDYIAEELKRPPHWVTRNGLEWLGRMIIEPRRLWKRYTIGNAMFAARLLRERLKQREL